MKDTHDTLSLMQKKPLNCNGQRHKWKYNSTEGINESLKIKYEHCKKCQLARRIFSDGRIEYFRRKLYI